ncbi:MAG: hypothetical protein K6G17_04820, partial [Oscillospiraceae bacterium]|nr:hypothetical protein [Oscillospiraceae bacterium]
GLAPAAEGAWTASGGKAAGLAGAVRAYRFFLPAADSGYRLRGADFELSFRRALALLPEP